MQAKTLSIILAKIGGGIVIVNYPFVFKGADEE